MDFNFLYGLFDVFVTLGSNIWKFLNTNIKIPLTEWNFPVYLAIISGGLVVGLTARLIRSFLGD